MPGAAQDRNFRNPPSYPRRSAIRFGVIHSGILLKRSIFKKLNGDVVTRRLIAFHPASGSKQPAATAFDIGITLADFLGHRQAEGGKDLIDVVPYQIGKTLHSISVHAAKLRGETC